MVYIQQAMNLALEHRKRGSPHYPRIHVISIQGDSLDNLPDIRVPALVIITPRCLLASLI